MERNDKTVNTLGQETSRNKGMMRTPQEQTTDDQDVNVKGGRSAYGTSQVDGSDEKNLKGVKTNGNIKRH